jgi:hypothetical protein
VIGTTLPARPGRAADTRPSGTAAAGTPVAIGLLVLGAAVTVAATVAGNGNILVAVAPVLLALGLALMWFAPLRIPLLTVAFLSLALDATDEGPWNSPLAPLGSLLAINLNKSLPIEALAIPGLVLILVYLLFINMHRRVRGLQTDGALRGRTAAVSLKSLGVSLLAVIGLCALGSHNGGDLQMAKIQVQTFVLVLLVAYLSAMALRGGRDHRVLGGVVLAAACFKALYAIYVVSTIVPPFEMSNGRLAYATTHGDSMLFAVATVMLIVLFAEQPVRRNAVLCATLLPLLMAGMVANNRRLVWAEVAAGVLAFWLISRRSRLKRFVVRTLIAAIPLILLYVAVGWNSQAQMFAPVKTFRSMGDSEVDASTLYRDLENYNLLATMRVNPIAGTGFGHPFAEPVKLPDISFFKEYRYMPHNSLLGLWAFCGPIGFTGLWFVFVVGVFFAARSYKCARLPEERVAAFMVIAAIVIFAMQCWGDIGFSERKSIFLVGPALAVAGQLAMSTGAWRNPSRRSS